MAQNIIVLGGNGFIGKNLCEALAAQNISYAVIDKSSGCDLATSDGQTMLEKIFKDAASDGSIDVVMAAANVGAKLFDAQPIEPFFTNLEIDMSTIKTMQKVAADASIEFHVSYCSTSEVYPSLDNPLFIPYPRSVSFCTSNGRSLYAQEKLLIETLLNHESKTSHWLKSLRVFRLFNVSGKYQKRGVVYDMVKSAVQDNEIHCSDGCSREITFVDDAIQQMLSRMLRRENGTFDVTSKNHIMLSDLAICIKNALCKISSRFNDVMLVTEKVNDFIANRGTVPLIRTKHEFDRFEQDLIRSNIINGLVEEIS